MNYIPVRVYRLVDLRAFCSLTSFPSLVGSIINALEALFLAKTPLRETSAMITDLRASWAAALPIWSGSLFSTTGGRERIERLFQFQDNALKAVREKAGAIGDRIVPGRLGDRIL